MGASRKLCIENSTTHTVLNFHALRISSHEKSICGLVDIRMYMLITGERYNTIHNKVYMICSLR